MKVLIMCGGKGTRLREETAVKPKPMVEIGGRPVLWHIMSIYARYGFKDFILPLGYKGEVIKQYFHDYTMRNTDFTVDLKSGDITSYPSTSEDWRVTLCDTGQETLKGARIKRVAKYIDTDQFMVTYGDGVADIDLAALLQAHRAAGKMLTVSAVHPPARFGEMVLDGDTVVDFAEKAPRTSAYVNGGFMVATRAFLNRYLASGKDEFLEQAPILNCVADRQMNAYRHEGFWQCMDTPREYSLLNDLWKRGDAPWTRYWNGGAR